MDPRKQATLLNYHLAIEDSVDIDKIWTDMEAVFTESEKRTIQVQHGKEEMRKFVDILATKDDEAFDTLVRVLRRDYRWLSARLKQGVRDEQQRILLAGKGIRQKIALALLTTRISDRQKDNIIANVSEVVEEELNDKALRVSIPDHRAGASLDRMNRRLKQIINDEVDPLLHGPGQRTDLSYEEIEEVVNKLQAMMVDMNKIQDCYDALGVHSFSGTGKLLPQILHQRIEETQTSVKILQQEKKQLSNDKAEVVKEKNEISKELTNLESQNRSLELQNRTLEEEWDKVDRNMKKVSNVRDSLEVEKRKYEEENMKLNSAARNMESENIDLNLKVRHFEDVTQKLQRDNQRLTSINSHLRREQQGGMGLSILKSENKVLTEEKTKLKTEVGKLEGEKRQITIKNQKLESENDLLKEQKRRLTGEKRKYWIENQTLKIEARRLAIGRYERPMSQLPPIEEDRVSRASIKTYGSTYSKYSTTGSMKYSTSNSQNNSTSNVRKYSNSYSNNAGSTGSVRNTSNNNFSNAEGKKLISTWSNTKATSTFPHARQPPKQRYRASVYDYRPKTKATQFPPKAQRYGNRA